MTGPRSERKDDGGSKVTELSSDEVKRVLGDLLSRVGYGGERAIITRHGKPIAALVSMKDFETLEPAA